ncbi:MAG: 23S rRNA (pseudouridine(1915)-N(3))-methyltransferase RlmH [Bacteroidia bacterium]|jgi:23S rRNA (pseudouridine1915-N3)-methyltransferase|nr:23S rRNA (pseudouridine(1915)-N(3))-methyltransferase RlmH [Bacteroidia bacterium]
MKIILVQIEKTNDVYLNEGIKIYTDRLKNYVSFQTETIVMNKLVRQKPFEEQKKAEAVEIEKLLLPSDYLVCLDEHGKQLKSTLFADFLNKRMVSGCKRLVFLIGGPFGIDQSILKHSSYVMSLSDMTFSHQMIRLFFCEQLYRGFSILKNEKYHHE